MMSSYQEQGYILHRRAFRERSCLVDFFGETFGKQRIVLPVTKSTKALLQPFVYLSLNVRGKSDLKNGSQVEALGKAEDLQGYFLYSAFYVNELIQYVVEDYEPLPQLFELYQKTLSALSLKRDLESTLRLFEAEFLSLSGYGIDFENDINGEKILPDCRYRFVSEFGFQFVSGDENLGFSGESLMAISNNDYQLLSTKKSAKQIFRQAINTLLDGRKLKSRQLFSQ